MAYSERYVAFVDILGFGEIVKTTERGAMPERVDALVKSLTEIGSHKIAGVGGSIEDDFKFQSFSDSIVMSCNASFSGLMYLLASINDLAIRLLSDGLLMRGAVAKGELYHDRIVMFGPAFLEAYYLETTIANFPRIVLSREARQDFKKGSGAVLFPRVLLSEDGPPHLDILAYFERRPNDPLKATCREKIQALLNEAIYVPKHYEKLRWLAIYWNSTVGKSDPSGRIDFPMAQNLRPRG